MEGNTQALAELVGSIFRVPQIDSTLTKSGYGADAKVVGDTFKTMSAQMQKTSKASGITYDGTNSGLESANVNNAIDEVYAFQKNGGRVNGKVQFGNSEYENGYGEISKWHTETEDGGTQIIDVNKNGESVKFRVMANGDAVSFIGLDGKERALHHDGNKPFWDYVGTGNELSLDTGGTGRLLLLYCDSYQALVSPKGALLVELTTGAISWLDEQNISFLNGHLTIVAGTTPLNATGTEYYYQVI